MLCVPPVPLICPQLSVMRHVYEDRSYATCSHKLNNAALLLSWEIHSKCMWLIVFNAIWLVAGFSGPCSVWRLCSPRPGLGCSHCRGQGGL